MASILDSNYFRIKPGQRVRIRVNDGETTSEISDVPYLINSEVSLRIATSYGPLTGITPNPSVTALLGSVQFFRDKGFTGAFKLQGFQVWQETKPLEFSLPLELRMVTDGKADVVDPANALIEKTVPTAPQGSGLVPPGPSLVRALNLSDEDANSLGLSRGDSFLSLVIGNYTYLPRCMVTEAVPTYSKELDENGYPIWCKLDTTFITSEVVTREMIQDMTKVSNF